MHPRTHHIIRILVSSRLVLLVVVRHDEENRFVDGARPEQGSDIRRRGVYTPTTPPTRRGTATQENKGQPRALSQTARFCIRIRCRLLPDGYVWSMCCYCCPYSCAAFYICQPWILGRDIAVSYMQARAYKIVSFRIGRQIHPRVSPCLPCAFILPTSALPSPGLSHLPWNSVARP